ncbi:cell wall metabolism sensor histidine kinase WalK [Kocuria sp. SM24M-10]|uniref:sensor histidine kinase n=1 Tax=Kocuria sp. SM24M-10 TaxID=1660349 RepID=UPI000AACC6AC|nr:PAS domain-containing sensor histidine kinase [Kocuria sp. SM24M-10]
MDSTLRFLSIRALHDSELPARRRALLNQLPLSITTALVYAGSAVFHTPLLANPLVWWSAGLIVLLLLACVVVPWNRLPARAVLVIPVLDFVPIGFLREGMYPEVTGTVMMLLFPVLWLVTSGLVPYGAALLGAAMTLVVVWVPVFLSPVPVTGDALTGPLPVPLLVLAIGATVQEITHQLRVKETQLREALATTAHRKRLLYTVLDSINSRVLAVDTDGRPLVTNYGMLADYAGQRVAHGAAAEASLPAMYTESGRPLASAQRPIARALAGESFTDHLVRYGDAPTQRVLSVSARTLHNNEQQPEGAVLSFHDVTELVNALNAQEEFVTGVSHELRTPLTSIRGYTELLTMDETLPETTRSGLGVIERNTEQLQNLVDDLLGAGNGATDLHPAPTDLIALLTAATAAAAPRAASGAVTLQTQAPQTLIAHCDPVRIGQVLDNLLSNAIKYSRPHSTVHVLATHHQDSARIQVIDQGIGMGPEDTGRVFERFYRSATARMSTIPGLGIGLALCREIIEQHGGTITCHSTLGEGTTMTITVPINPPSATPASGGASTTDHDPAPNILV